MKHILLISTKDRSGLIYQVSKILHEAGLNIEKNDEFVDRDAMIFFMRTQIAGALDEKWILATLQNALDKDAHITLKPMAKKSLIILATKENHCLGDLLLRYDSGELHAHIQAVIANHNDLERACAPF